MKHAVCPDFVLTCNITAQAAAGVLTFAQALDKAASGLLAESGTVVGRGGKQYAWRIKGGLRGLKWRWRFLCSIDGNEEQLAETKGVKGAQEHGLRAMQQRGLI